jgi:Fe-S-cluster containining protein
MGLDNPCVQCGACCAFFRVSFYWEETTLANPQGVPQALTEKLSDFLQCMQGSNRPEPRCIALRGKIGEEVSCAIYAQRSSTCREFGLHLEQGCLDVDGENLIRCNVARKAWNLPPLARADLRLFAHYPPVRSAPAPHFPFHHQHPHHHTR